MGMSANHIDQFDQLEQLDLSIIIVSWNVCKYLAACLDSIRHSIQANAGSLKLEVIVVDSASTDGTTAMLKELYPWVKLLPQAENIGFTRGNNLGLAAACGRYVMLLNPDTEIVGDALSRMARILDEMPTVGIVGPHTLNTDGTTQSTRRRFPTLTTALFETPSLQPYTPQKELDRYHVSDIQDSATADVDWIQGSALMARRQVYEQIGPFDEKYVMFYEEVDWCKRARQATWRVFYAGDADIIHHGGRSTDQVVAFKHIYYQQSKLRYFQKYHGQLAAWLLRGALLVSYAHQLALEAAKALLGHKRAMRRERVGVYWQVIRALSLPGARG